jgi:RNA polymerase sigma-70 factor (ECF subfamily)
LAGACWKAARRIACISYPTIRSGRLFSKLNQNPPACDYNNEMIEQVAIPSKDHQLLQQTAGGNEAAFGELYRCYEVPVFNYLYNLVRDQSAAEDLLQEVFLAVWHGARRFRGQSQVKTWLYHIAHNQAVSWLRRYRQVTSFDEVVSLPSTDEDLEGQVLESLENHRLRQALDSLSPAHRAVVDLAFFHDLSYTEIAQVIECPIGTVKSRMSHARHYLSQALLEFSTAENREEK